MSENGPDDDFELFRKSLDGVTPLTPDRVEPARKRLAPVPGQRLADNANVVRELEEAAPYWDDNEMGDELWFARPGLQHKTLKRLRRGQYSISETLDLHGQTVEEARSILNEFLADCRARGIRGVKIIHGKGLRSPGGRPVLKSKLDAWLRRRDEVVAFCSAPPNDGGTGAAYVLLKR